MGVHFHLNTVHERVGDQLVDDGVALGGEAGGYVFRRGGFG